MKNNPITTKIAVILSFMFFAGPGQSCFAQKNKEKPLVLKNMQDSLSYSIGVLIGSDLKSGGFGEMNYEIMNRAMSKAMKEDSLLLSREESSMILQAFAMAEMKKKADANQKIAGEFLESNKMKEGVKTTASGLQYKINTTGSGAVPTDGQTVTVHYTGTFADGKVFDSSVQRGEPAKFGVNQVIKGWTEALLLMPVGSKWTLYIPPALAYGETGNDRIPGNSLLIFEVELIAVE
ncbi:MAG: FKBP-type peptidyl-prolyl cis-trans isomerase [Flavobacteriales bacterium]|nr:FKBP-type peptidyl-prolyl cis-trans isomerase [Flavobacteriales bacterium]